MAAKYLDWVKSGRWAMSEKITIQQAQVMVLLMEATGFRLTQDQKNLHDFEKFPQWLVCEGKLMRFARRDIRFGTYMYISYQKVIDSLTAVVQEKEVKDGSI